MAYEYNKIYGCAIDIVVSCSTSFSNTDEGKRNKEIQNAKECIRRLLKSITPEEIKAFHSLEGSL